MNRKADGSRFTRGRCRGGGGYRPYYYFRRNGRVVPAGGQNPDAGGPSSRYRGRSRGRRYENQHNHSTEMAAAALDSTFLRPEHYAAPENALQVHSISTDSPLQCPGWRLYFPNEIYENSELRRQINLLETHYNNNVSHYNLLDIQRKRYFVLDIKVLTTDTLVAAMWPTLQQDLNVRPERTLATFGVAMHSLVTVNAIDISLSQQSCSREFFVPHSIRPQKIYVRPVGLLDVSILSNVSNTSLDSLVCVRGIVIAMGSVDAAASWISFKCTRCGQEQAMKQIGYHYARPYSCKREKCLAKKGFIEQRSSPHTRLTPKQIIRLTECHLQAQTNPNRELPDQLDVELRHDLVDSVYTGQDIVVTGILKRRPMLENYEATNSSVAKTNAIELYLKVLSITDAEKVSKSFTARDVDAIAMINDEPDSFKLLVHSLAPELHGQELAKAGVLLSLFGGAGSQLHDDSEINVLLVGDPGIGKSEVLQICAKLSHRGELLSGKSSAVTGNTLTPVIQGRSHYSIHAGAVICSLNGHCVIDDIDRVTSQQETLLQVMQSQIITIPFASLFTTINTPTAVIATGNSMRGHYDHAKLLNENIRIHPSLLNQFHLVFLLLDKPNKDMDTSLTEHIRALHAGTKKSATIAARFAMKPKTNNSMNISLHDGSAEDDENYDLGKRLQINELDDVELDLLPSILIKKFIAYARQQVKPLLTVEAAEALKEFYMDLRKQKSGEKFCSVGTRVRFVQTHKSNGQNGIPLANIVHLKSISRSGVNLNCVKAEVGKFVNKLPREKEM